MRDEGHSVADWGIGGYVKLLLRVQSPFVFGQWIEWMAANCATPPTAGTGQYFTSNCKPLLFEFPCKWQHINVGTFNL